MEKNISLQNSENQMNEVKQNSILEQAKKEVAADDLKRAVKLYKAKLDELNTATTVVDNINREIADLELKIEQGNY